MKKRKENKFHIYVIFIALITFVFFSKNFIPNVKLFYTADYGRSDIWNQNYPFKNFLSESLKQGKLPFWNKQMGTGFPIFSEGQIGTFYLPNLFLFYLFPTWLAWNLSYLNIFFLCFLGTFVFFRYIGISDKSSLFSAFAFSFSGYFVARIVHINCIQSASLMPWLFFLALKYWRKSRKGTAILFAIVISQMIFAGGFQWVFISLLGSFIFLLSQNWDKSIDEFVKKMTIFIVIVGLGFLLAAPQLLPTIEYKRISMRKNALTYNEIFRFPFKWKHLVNFISPNYYGTPKDGSYPSPFETDLGIYWENSVYIGLLPLIFFLIAMIKKKKGDVEKSFIILLILSLLLSLGKDSPLSFIYTFPAFNQFRVTSRFLILTCFSLTALSGHGLDLILKKISQMKISSKVEKIIYPLILTLLVFDLFYYEFNFHPLVTVEEALSRPDSLRNINPEKRVLTYFSQGKYWNEVMFNKGWKDPKLFMYFKNGLDANLNLLYGLTQIQEYTAFKPTRSYIKEMYLNELINASAVDYIISPDEFKENESLKLLSVVEAVNVDLPNYFIYKNENALERLRLVSKYKVIKSPHDVDAALSDEDFSFSNYVLLEVDIGQDFNQLNTSDVQIEEDRDGFLKLRTNTDAQAILVVADSYDPYWRVKINGEESTILPANLYQRAVIIPAGNNLIELKYELKPYKTGVTVAFSTIILIAVVIFFDVKMIKKKYWNKRNRGKKQT